MKQNYAKIISGFILAGLLTFSSCQSTHEMAKTDYQIAKVEGRMIDIDAKWDTHPDADAVAILKPYKEKIDNMMYEVIGSSEQKMDKGHPESLLSNLVADDSAGCCSYTLLIDNKPNGTIKLGVPGEHNVYNSLAAIAVAIKLGLDLETIKKGLCGFSGTDRRFQKKGTFNGVTVVDDYAHHPDEITATLDSAKHFPHNRTWCVFQPHTYSRTKALLGDFAKALSAADIVVLADIYAARETDNLGISSADLQKAIGELGKECYYFHSFEEIEKFLLKNCINGDLLITMGAGDIYKVGEALVNQ